MKCNNCTAEQLNGFAFDTSELCTGPVDGEVIESGELMASFRGVCHAVIAAKIMTNQYRPGQLRLRPAVNTEVTVIDLTETPVEFPQSA